MTTDNLQDYLLLEHPSDTISRLKAMGVWPEAERLLRAVKQRNRNQFARNGATMTEQQRLDVNYAGWIAVQERWPPPADARPLESLAEYLRTTRGVRRNGKSGLPMSSAEADERFAAMGAPNFQMDVIWVYDQLDNPRATPLDAPSRGAWSLLREARQDRAWFFKYYHAPAARAACKGNGAVDDEADEGAANLAREKMHIDEIRAMIEAVKAELETGDA